MAGQVMVAMLAVLAVTSSATQSQRQHHHPHKTKGDAVGFVANLAFQHRLRVCNAYPYSAAMDVVQGKETVTGDTPMPYKECRDFLAPLKSGDKLQFKVGDATAGYFVVSDLPNNDAILLLVIHRHDTDSTAVSFESHVFANLLNAQVAIIDTYKGSRCAKMDIMDANRASDAARKEELRFNTVVALNPGLYHVELTEVVKEKKSKHHVIKGHAEKQKAGNHFFIQESSAPHESAVEEVESGAEGVEHGLEHDAARLESEVMGTRLSGKDLVALNRESYIVLRVGVEAQHGPSYPQELVIYPASDPNALHHSKASTISLAISLVLLMVGAVTN